MQLYELKCATAVLLMKIRTQLKLNVRYFAVSRKLVSVTMLSYSIQRIQIINSREIRCSNSHLAALCH